MILRLLILSTIAFSGCANFELNTKEDCSSINWYNEGLTDASEGKAKNQYQINECSKHLGKAASDKYLDGYASGLIKFCTYESGLYWGRKGNNYENHCPRQLENNFLSGYSKGKLDFDNLQIKKTNSESLKKMSDSMSNQTPVNAEKTCFTSFDCEIKDKCIQDSTSNFISDRICQNRKQIKCFSDWDCEIKGECKERKCSYKK